MWITFHFIWHKLPIAWKTHSTNNPIRGWDNFVLQFNFIRLWWERDTLSVLSVASISKQKRNKIDATTTKATSYLNSNRFIIACNTRHRRRVNVSPRRIPKNRNHRNSHWDSTFARNSDEISDDSSSTSLISIQRLNHRDCSTAASWDHEAVIWCR